MGTMIVSWIFILLHLSAALIAVELPGRLLTDACAKLKNVKMSKSVQLLDWCGALFVSLWCMSMWCPHLCWLIELLHPARNPSLSLEWVWAPTRVKQNEENVFLQETRSHSLFFAVVQGVGGGQPPIRAWLPPAGEGLFFRRTTSGQCWFPWRAVA